MKRYFMIALACILVLSVGIVLYGVWLNKAGEQAIVDRMSSRALALQGEVVQVREIRPLQRWSMVKLYTEEMVDAVARVDGVIQSVMVDQQTLVHKGEVLVRLQNEDIPLKIRQADGNIAKAEAEQKRAYNAYQRQRQLIALHATPSERLDEAEAAYKSACASIDELNASREQLLVQQRRQNVESPITGDVLLLYRRPGTFVTAGTPVALIGAFEKLCFKTAMQDGAIHAMLPMDEKKEVVFNQKDFTKVYHTDYEEGNQGKEQRFEAHILSVTPELSVPAELRYVVWEIDNSSGMLEPQTYHDIYIQTPEKRMVLTAPLSAMADQNHDAVYVYNSAGQVEYRSVRAGSDDGRYIEIIEGLQEGDIVITSGAEGLETGVRADVEIKGAERDGR